VYANVAAALATGRHVVLVGPPGSGRTTLALAVAKAAVEAGKADGAELVGAAATEQIVGAASRNRWLVIDGLVLDDSLTPLAAFLAHLPVTREEGEVSAPETWRIVATAAEMPTGALSTRFAAVHTAPHQDLEAAIDQAAGGDQVAAAAVRRLLPLRDAVGAGPYLAAARHAAERRAAAPADEETLAREARTAYFEPLVGEEERNRL
jgi:energy-coupling factor transporter ATP-binding protein EcfA2